MKSLITGITGFAGSHLAELLVSKGDEVSGIYRWRSPMENLDEKLQKKIKLSLCDLVDLGSVQEVIDKTKPDRIFHLAAQSFVPTSWVSPSVTLEVNKVLKIHIHQSFAQPHNCFSNFSISFLKNFSNF